MLSGDLPVNLFDAPVSQPVSCPLVCLSSCLSADIGCACQIAGQLAYQLIGDVPIGGCSGLSAASCLPCNLPVEKEKKAQHGSVSV